MGNSNVDRGPLGRSVVASRYVLALEEFQRKIQLKFQPLKTRVINTAPNQQNDGWQTTSFCSPRPNWRLDCQSLVIESTRCTSAASIDFQAQKV